MATTSKNLFELVGAVLDSPRGLIALVAIGGSLLVFVLMFLFKGNKNNSKRSSKLSSSASKRSTPIKFSKKITPTPIKKASPAKKEAVDTSNSKSKTATSNATEKKSVVKKNTKSDSAPINNASAKKTTSTVTTGASGGQVTANAKVPTNNVLKSQSNQAKASKDDGEWITVAKKKPRVVASKQKLDLADADADAVKSPPVRPARTGPPRTATSLRTPRRS